MNANTDNSIGIDRGAIAGALDAVRGATPLVHCITNYVTVNDCANALLAVGASPVMADDAGEIEDIVGISNALVINIGTLNERTIRSMVMAGKAANRRGIPVVLDPVGAGASGLRTETARSLVETIRFAVIRGNASEIRTLLAGTGATRGVDAQAEHSAEGALGQTIDVAVQLAVKTESVVVVTGATDVVTDGKAIFAIGNGHVLMSRITGSGCMLSAITGAFAATGGERLVESIAAGVSYMGLAGEYAARDAEALGTGSFRTKLVDHLSILDRARFEQGMRIARRA